MEQEGKSNMSVRRGRAWGLTTVMNGHGSEMVLYINGYSHTPKSILDTAKGVPTNELGTIA